MEGMGYDLVVLKAYSLALRVGITPGSALRDPRWCHGSSEGATCKASTLHTLFPLRPLFHF